VTVQGWHYTALSRAMDAAGKKLHHMVVAVMAFKSGVIVKQCMPLPESSLRRDLLCLGGLQVSDLRACKLPRC
jgi:hypothetical protein